MKKTILNMLIAFLAFGGASLAYADTVVNADLRVQDELPRPFKASSTLPVPLKKAREFRRAIQASTTEAIKDIRKDVKADIKDIRDRNASSTDRRTEIKNKILEGQKDIAQKKVENRFDKMNVRVKATIQREEEIMSKVNTRISKIKVAGGNTTDAEKFVLEAKVHLDEAKASYVALTAASDTEISIETTASSTEVRTAAKSAIADLRRIGSELEKHIHEAHASLQKAVKSLMITTGENKVEATTSVNFKN